MYDNRVDAVEFKVPLGQTYFSAAYGKMASLDTYGWTDGTKGHRSWPYLDQKMIL